jgi:DNA-binding MarR family transcriptional regulator
MSSTRYTDFLKVNHYLQKQTPLRYDPVTMEEEDVARDIDLLIDDVFDLAHALRASGDTIAGTAGQTQARWLVLRYAAPGHYTIPDIARRIGRHRQSVQRITDELTAENLARYTPNPDHARSPLVQLTPAGHDTLAKIEETARQRRLTVTGRFDATEIATARAVLAKIMAASRAAAAGPPDGQATPNP